jgi:hypothetical protein
MRTRRAVGRGLANPSWKRPGAFHIVAVLFPKGLAHHLLLALDELDTSERRRPGHTSRRASFQKRGPARDSTARSRHTSDAE